MATLPPRCFCFPDATVLACKLGRDRSSLRGKNVPPMIAASRDSADPEKTKWIMTVGLAEDW